jgi:hypothetical protein
MHEVEEAGSPDLVEAAAALLEVVGDDEEERHTHTHIHTHVDDEEEDLDISPPVFAEGD